MTALVFVFWGALLVPGYAAARRFDPRVASAGLLSRIALGYLASFALLTPLSVACYAAHLPLAVFSSGLGVAVVAGAVLLWRARGRERSVAGFDWLGAIVGLFILVDLVLSARAGSHMGGDAGYHVARVRMLLDHGFNAWDPLVPGRRFDHVYHTNLYHALLASCAQLTGTDAGAAWLGAFPWAKLVCIAGTYHLAFALSQRRWVASMSALVAVFWLAPYTVLPYPNTLAPHWLLALGFAFCAQHLSDETDSRARLWLGAAALALAQVHSLYALFLALLVGPVLGVALGVRMLQKGSSASRSRALLGALVAACLGLPWVVASTLPKLQAALASRDSPPALVSQTSARASEVADVAQEHSSDEGEATAQAQSSDDDVPSGFVAVGTDWLMADPRGYFGANNRFTHTLLLLAFGLFTRERRRVLPFTGIAATAVAVFFVPPLTTALVEAAGAGWILMRMRMVFVVLALAFMPAAAFWFLEELVGRRMPKAALQLACAVLAGAYGYHNGIDDGAWTRQAYLSYVLQNRFGEQVERYAATRELFAAVTPGALLMAQPQHDYRIIAHCDCHPFAFRESRGKHGIADVEARRDAAALFFDSGSSADERLGVLERYGLRHVFAASKGQARMLTRDLRERVSRRIAVPGTSGRVLVFELEQAPSQARLRSSTRRGCASDGDVTISAERSECTSSTEGLASASP